MPSCWCINSEPVNIGRGADFKINPCRGAHGLFPAIQLLKISPKFIGKEATTTEKLSRWQTKLLKAITCANFRAYQHYNFRVSMTEHVLIFLEQLGTYKRLKERQNYRQLQKEPTNTFQVFTCYSFMDFQVLRWKDRHPFRIKPLLPVIHYGGSHWVFCYKTIMEKLMKKIIPHLRKENTSLALASILKLKFFSPPFFL